MANHIVDKTYNAVLRKLEPTDPGHADTFNTLFGQLINNDEHLKESIESVKKGDLPIPDLPTDDKTLGGSITEINKKQESLESQQVESTGYGVISGLEVKAQIVPDMTVKVSAGIVHMQSGARVECSGNPSLAINAADLTNARKDIIYVNADESIGYTPGTPSSVPSAPITPVGAFLLAEIYVAANATTITDINLTDKRKIKITVDDLKREVDSQKAEIVKKPTTAIGNNVAIFDTNQDAIKDSGKSIGNTAGKILELPVGLTTGDILRVGVGGIERLAKGIDGQALVLSKGLPTWGSLQNSKTFAVAGTYQWTVPAGVNIVYITATGAGGGGASGAGGGGGYGNVTPGQDGSPSNPGSAGGATSFGSLLTLSGGGGGTTKNDTAGRCGNSSTNSVAGIGAIGGAAGNAINDYLFLSSGAMGNNGVDGQSGSSIKSELPTIGASAKNTFAAIGEGGKGGNGGIGGRWGSDKSGYQHGASGAGGSSGGTGAYCCRYPVTVSAGDTITITIGEGGNGGAIALGGKGGTNGSPYQSTISTSGGDGTAGSKGGDGYLMIEW